MSITRRQFTQRSLVAAAGPLILSAAPGFGNVSPNERIGIAVAGVRGRGNSLLHSFAHMKDVVITHVCDLQESVRNQRAGEVSKIKGDEPRPVKDYRTILDDKNVYALVLGTPDHWHAIPTIHACQAGKDVYVEKPDGHNIVEGKTMVAAARKHERCVQMGTQLRSAPFLHEARQYVADGKLGKVLYGKAWESARQGAIPRVPDSDPPADIDYDMWLGPAPKRPFNRYRFHGNWRWFFDYGCGDLGNDGVHRLDYCMMIMGIDQFPTTISAAGGKMFFDDAQEFPDTLVATYTFGGEAGGDNRPPKPAQMMTYEMRIWSRPPLHGATEGAAIYGEAGWMLITNRRWKAFDPQDNVVAEGGDDEAQRVHTRNFLDCMRTRKWQDLNQEIASGHRSSVLCHAGNIAWRTGKTLRFDAETETFDDNEANKLVGREYRKGYELPGV